jgi:uncharacterized protein YcbX
VNIVELWRYPVKSMLGEQVDEATLDAAGIPHDRSWAVWLPGKKRPLSAKREPLLFEARARVDGDAVVVTLPSGFEATAGDPSLDPALAEWLGYEATMQPAPEGHVFDDSPIHVLSTSSLHSMAARHEAGVWDRRRFRPSIVVDGAGPGFPEEAWIGSHVAVGSTGVGLDITHPCSRCTMVGLAQSELPDDLGILESVMAHNAENLGVYATVLSPGSVSVGDELAFEPRP